jgi:hypothetical protein
MSERTHDRDETAETTASHQPGFSIRSPGDGIAVLDPAQTALFRELDREFVAIAEAWAAPELTPPGLLPTAGLARLDYFVNFPHLCVPAGQVAADTMADLAGGTAWDELPDDAVHRTGYVLPSATCYGVFLALEQQDLREDVRVTAVGRCFRNEDRFDGLRRLRGFHMREVVFVGGQAGADGHLADSRVMTEKLATRLGIELQVVPANDPFYTRSGSRARLTALDPVKYEFVATDGTAIASINRHRNFFGERLSITRDGSPAYSSCLAFGIERWIHALTRQHGSAEAALDRIRAARTTPAGDGQCY